jgi:hypothetical protein
VTPKYPIFAIGSNVFSPFPFAKFIDEISAPIRLLPTQIRRFFDAVTALMSRQMRSMALSSLEAFVDHMKSYAGGNDWGDVDHNHIIIPMFNLREGAASAWARYRGQQERNNII